MSWKLIRNSSNKSRKPVRKLQLFTVSAGGPSTTSQLLPPQQQKHTSTIQAASSSTATDTNTRLQAHQNSIPVSFNKAMPSSIAAAYDPHDTDDDDPIISQFYSPTKYRPQSAAADHHQLTIYNDDSMDLFTYIEDDETHIETILSGALPLQSLATIDEVLTPAHHDNSDEIIPDSQQAYLAKPPADQVIEAGQNSYMEIEEIISDGSQFSQNQPSNQLQQPIDSLDNFMRQRMHIKEKRLKPVKGGLLELLKLSVKQETSTFNLWSHYRESGVFLQPGTRMRVSKTELNQYGRFVVYANEINADATTNVFTFDTGGELSKKLTEGTEFEVDLSKEKGYPIYGDGCSIAYPCVRNVLIVK